MRKSALGLFGLAIVTLGCALAKQPETLAPSKSEWTHEQLVLHSDFTLPRKHRLLEEVAAKRGDIADELALPLSDEPIHVYLFNSRDDYEMFLRRVYPEFPERRACFIETDTRLAVYAYWGDRVAEDLRHEVTHGYLHAVVRNLPLWLDEGLAEYFETPRGHHGRNQAHIDRLARLHNRAEWSPDLRRLEQMQRANDMSQTDYAESWAWCHWLLRSSPEHREVVQSYLARLRIAGEALPLSHYVEALESDPNAALVEHLKSLVRK